MDSDPDGNARVLYAFESSKVRERLGSWLRKARYHAVEADSARGLRASLSFDPPDLVILDACLGADGRDGMDLVEAVRLAMGSAPPILLVTAGEPSQDLSRQAEALGTSVRSRRMLSSKTLLPLIRERLVGETPQLSEGELISLCEHARMSDPFVALSVDADVRPGELRRRYRRLRAIVGPDAQKRQSPELRPLMEAACLSLRAAYDKLTDPEAFARWQDRVEQVQAKPAARRAARKPVRRAAPRAEAEPVPEVAEATPAAPPEPQAESEPAPEEDPARWFADERDSGSEPGGEVEDEEALERKREAARIAQEGDRSLEQGEWLSALDAFRRAAELRPKAGQYRAMIGWAIYLSHGADGLREAIDHAKTGMKLSPEHPHPPLVLGRLYQMTDRLDLAEKALKRAIRLQPDCADAVRELRILKSRSPGKGSGLVSRLLGRR